MNRIKLVKIPRMLLALIIRGRKLLYFSKNDQFALIGGQIREEMNIYQPRYQPLLSVSVMRDDFKLLNVMLHNHFRTT